MHAQREPPPGAQALSASCPGSRLPAPEAIRPDGAPIGGHEIDPTPATVTRLLDRAGAGDRAALDDVFRLVYRELQIIARRQRGRWDGDHTLGTTVLVHETYLKLVGQAPVSVTDRAHFFALAARAMRQVLCNYARDRRAAKRGGAEAPVTLDESVARDARQSVEQADLLLSLDEALRALEDVHPRASRVVECRFFGGMTVEETGAALHVSVRTVKRDWALAQAWLHRAMEGGS